MYYIFIIDVLFVDYSESAPLRPVKLHFPTCLYTITTYKITFHPHACYFTPCCLHFKIDQLQVMLLIV